VGFTFQSDVFFTDILEKTEDSEGCRLTCRVVICILGNHDISTNNLNC